MPENRKNASRNAGGRGSAVERRSAEPQFLVAGHIRAPHGVKGELRVQVLTDFPERFQPGAEVWVGDFPQPFRVERARFTDDIVRLRLAGVGDRTAAEALRGLDIRVPRGEAMPLPEGTFYIHDIVGLEVWTEEGERLGEVSEVMSLPANDVYVVDSEQGEILLPAIRDVILDIDIETGRLTVRMLPGLR